MPARDEQLGYFVRRASLARESLVRELEARGAGEVLTGSGVGLASRARRRSLEIVIYLQPAAGDVQVPAHWKGFATRVVRAGPESSSFIGRGTHRHNLPRWPIVAGTSVGSEVLKKCATCSCVVSRKTEPGTPLALLSNHAVSRPPDRPTVGDEVVQPGHRNGYSRAGVKKLGRVVEFETIDFADPAHTNTMDVAVVAVEDASISGKVLGLGTPTHQPVIPSLGMKVTKSGCGSGVTRGRVRVLDLTRDVQFSDGCTARFRGLFMVEGWGWLSHFARAGDSGALCLTTHDLHPVGLVVSVNHRERYALACPIGSYWQSNGFRIFGRK